MIYPNLLSFLFQISKKAAQISPPAPLSWSLKLKLQYFVSTVPRSEIGQVPSARGKGLLNGMNLPAVSTFRLPPKHPAL